MGIKKVHVFTKLCWQCFLAVVEFGGISFLFYSFTNKIVLCITLIDIIERFLLGLAIYELIIFITLTYINDARKDALLALKTAYNKAILYCETGNEDIKVRLLSRVEKILDTGMLNHIDVRNEYTILLEQTAQKNMTVLKERLIDVEHLYEYTSLQWRYTLLLRLFK